MRNGAVGITSSVSKKSSSGGGVSFLERGKLLKLGINGEKEVLVK